MTVVVYASCVAASLIGRGRHAAWAGRVLTGGHLAAPHLLPVEVTSVLRRGVQSGGLSSDGAALAHADLEELRVGLFPYAPFGRRIWELRENLTAYDGWYVALAEALGAELATPDRRLGRASGPRCAFALPPAWEGDRRNPRTLGHVIENVDPLREPT